MKKTYTPVQSNFKFIDIIEYLHKQTELVSGTQIALALNMPLGTVMSHLQSAVERNWIRQVETLYEPGSRVAGMYAAYLLGLKEKLINIDHEIKKLEG